MKTTVLVIDDSATFRQYLRSGLEAEGYLVMTAESGEQGLSIAQTAAIDAFMVDHVLPGIDGASVVRRLRQQVRHRRTPSLLLTASDDPTQELNALEAGADAFVRKDESIDVLLARLAAVLRSVGTPADSAPEAVAPSAASVLFLDVEGTPAEESARRLAGEGIAVRMENASQPSSLEFDCIVANVGSVEQGAALVGELRARPQSRAARLVLLGQSDSRSQLVEAIALGADDYLPWSAGEAVLTARLRAQLRRKQLEDENELVRENLLRHRLELETQKQVAAARLTVAEELRAARDLAERKAREAEDLLAQNEAVFRSMTEGLLIAGLDGKLLQINESALTIFGAADRPALEAMLDVHSTSCSMKSLDGSLLPASDWPLTLAIRGVAINGAELTFLHPQTGHSFTGSFNAVPVNNRDGDRILAAVTVRDITAQKRSEDLLRRAEQLAVTGRLAASIAHEVNNPLSSVMNLLFLLQNAVQADPEAARLLAMAQRELQRVADITRQTLAFYRDTSRPAEVDVCALAVEVEEIFSAKLHASGIEMRMELECDARPLAFAGELRQVISNLVSNAIDASTSGGKVRLRLRQAERKGKPGIRISVADRGPGIPRPYYPDLFQPFSSRKQTGGTGLGLWVAHSIVARHDGSIRFRSCTDEGNSGAVFSVFIPLASTIKVDRSDTIGKLFRELGEELLTPQLVRRS